jgi:hypothetical protein
MQAPEEVHDPRSLSGHFFSKNQQHDLPQHMEREVDKEILPLIFPVMYLFSHLYKFLTNQVP